MGRLLKSFPLLAVFYLLFTIFFASPVWAQCYKVVPIKKKLPDGTVVEELVQVGTISCLGDYIKNIISFLFPLASLVAFLFLLFGGIRFITSGGEPKAAEGAKKTITYALWGLGVIFCVWLIFNLIYQLTGLDLTRFNIVVP